MKWWIKAQTKPFWKLNDEEIKIQEQWINDNIGKRYTKSVGYFHFRTKRDAALFTLRWA
jgi:hypothetical protein